MKEESNTVADTIRTATFWTGIALIIAGVAGLLGLAAMALDIIKNPEGVALVKWLAEKTAETELFLNGHIGEVQFELKTSPALQYVFLGIIGMILINILVSIVQGLLRIGAELIQFAGTQRPDNPVGKR